jgi:hypothetical protein
MLATKYLPFNATDTSAISYIERRERIFYAGLLDTTIKFDQYMSWDDSMHGLEDIQYAICGLDYLI